MSQTDGPSTRSPKPGWTQAAATITALLILVLLVGAAWLFSGWFVGKAPPPPTYAGLSVETEFNKDVVDTIGPNNPLLTASVFTDEWPAARSVHKILAYTIARCRRIPTAQMTRQQFSTLLLDLRPDGGHSWVKETGEKETRDISTDVLADTSKTQGDTPNQTPPPTLDQLELFDQAMLAISDSIARARLAAARGADKFFPDMIRFGWAAVIISALATMFVTLKASLSPNPSSESGTFGWHWERFWIFTFGFLAIGLSTTTTILASAKQFWDPTAAYMRNEGTLVALRQLHEQIVLDFVSSVDRSCHPADENTSNAKLARWINTLITLQPGTLAAPVLIPVANSSPVANNSSPFPLQSGDQGSGRGQANVPSTQSGQPSPAREQP